MVCQHLKTELLNMVICVIMKQVRNPTTIRSTVTRFLSMAALVSSFSCAPDQVLPSRCTQPPSTQTEWEIERIFGFNSMLAVEQRFGSCVQRETIARLIESYQPCQRLDQVDAAFNRVFDQARTTPEERVALVNVAHSFYVELNQLVPWSLEDYSAAQIQFLIPTNNRAARPYPPNMVPSHLQNAEDVEAYRVLPVALRLSRTNQLETARQVAQWIAMNFFHPYVRDDESYLAFDCTQLYNSSDYGPPGTTCQFGTRYLKTDALFRERNLTAGCHTAASLGATVFRSINIPAAEVDFGSERSRFDAGHGILYLPSLGLYSHGDWLASGATGRAGEYFLYPYGRFMETTLNMWNGSGWGQDPIGEWDALFSVTLYRRANTRMLYVQGVFDIYEFQQPPDRILSPITGFRNDIQRPLPQTLRMLQILSIYEPRFEYVPNDPRRAQLVSRNIPIATLEESRQNACR